MNYYNNNKNKHLGATEAPIHWQNFLEELGTGQVGLALHWIQMVSLHARHILYFVPFCRPTFDNRPTGIFIHAAISLVNIDTLKIQNILTKKSPCN